MGEDAVLTNRHVVDVEQDRNIVTVHYVDKQTGAPVLNGNMLWRMTVETEPVLGEQIMLAMGHSALKVVDYEISREAKTRGRSLFNCIAEVRTGHPSAALPEREGWNHRGDAAEFIPYFQGWKFDWLDVPALAEKSDPVWVFPMIDRNPVEQWTFGMVTLLGDAAHPMWPIGSNGASQAVLDARCLTDQLLESQNVTEALQAYQSIRLPETAKVVFANRRNAHDQILDIAEQRAPEGFSDINEFTSAKEIEDILAGYRTTARFSGEQLQPE